MSQEPMNNFTPRAQQVLALARKEADRFNHNYVGTEHLLLGLLREEKGIAAQALTDCGVNLEAARTERRVGGHRQVAELHRTGAHHEGERQVDRERSLRGDRRCAILERHRDRCRRIGLGNAVGRGRGVGQFVEVTAPVAGELGKITFNHDGSVTIFTGSHDHGQGHWTTFAQVLSAELGVPSAVVEAAESAERASAEERDAVRRRAGFRALPTIPS